MGVSSENIQTVIDYLNRYQGKQYVVSNKLKTSEQKIEMLEFKKNGQEAVDLLHSIANTVRESALPNYEIVTNKRWFNAAQKGLTYFWIEYKKTGYKDSKSSISLFISVEQGCSSPVFLAVEAKDNKCSELDYKKHNRLVYKELESSNLYLALKYKKDATHYITNLSREEVIEEYEKGKLDKVRLQLDIKAPYDNLLKRLEEGVKELEPYYLEAISDFDEENDGINEGDSKYNVKIEGFYPKNMILYGPPGTGKTYHTIYYSVGIIEGKSYDVIVQEPYEDVLQRYTYYNQNGQVMFTTFHQSYGYEEFIEGIKPKLIDSNLGSKGQDTKDDNLLYTLEPGKFKMFCKRALGYMDNEQDETKNFVFIIDEINRGNISKIFGELITLIEASKRLGEKEEMTLQLPYSEEAFGVPNNVYIIGTMNTADRSIALMDTALRRRFNFIEMMPTPQVLEKIDQDIMQGISVSKILEVMNHRIAVLYDREHTIGHAYFASLIEEPSVKKLAEIFKNSIIPLLQEYFYEDYEKIQLVLGDNAKSDNQYKFIVDRKLNVSEIFKGDVDVDIMEKDYEIQNQAFLCAQSYIEIYS